MGPIRTAAVIDDLVLGTVNAPWKYSVDAEQLAEAVSAAVAASDISQLAHPAHLMSFFTEVSTTLVLQFAGVHQIPGPKLSASYEQFKSITGEINPALEDALVRVG